MNIQRKVVKVELNNREYDFILDFESAISFQDGYGKSIFFGIDKIVKEQDLIALAHLIASCLKDKNGSVGLDFVKKLDLMSSLEFFMSKLTELMDNSLQQENNSSKKKLEKKKKN